MLGSGVDKDFDAAIDADLAYLTREQPMRVRAVYMEYVDSSSRKFYATFTAKGEALVHWGRIGTRGQSQIVHQSEAYERIGEKRKRYTVLFDDHIEFDGNWNQIELMQAMKTAKRKKESDAHLGAQEQEAIFTW